MKQNKLKNYYGKRVKDYQTTSYLNFDLFQGKKIPVLYSQKNECCGCSACFNKCKAFSKGAISMETDSEGFYYPVVDLALCCGCMLCVGACGFKYE